MPSTASLSQRRYYAHPRNHFWPLIESLFGIARDLPYRRRCAELTGKKVAVWDVLSQCLREGSLDSSIVDASVVPNDIFGFLQRNAGVKNIFFNGRKSEQLFKRHIAPKMADLGRDMECRCLPSTSPANASLSLQEKLRAWRVVAEKAGATRKPSR